MNRVFLSYDRNDINQKDLKCLEKNTRYEIEYYDKSVNVAIDSNDASNLKKEILKRIIKSDVTVCIISENTYKNEWVNWELAESDESNNKIIAMAHRGVTSAVVPKLIKEKRLKFHEWNPEGLKKLIEK